MQEFTESVGWALKGDLPMRILRRGQRSTLYVGLWSTWQVGSEVSAAKILLATVAQPHAEVDSVPLMRLPWVILQLQSIRDSDTIWGAVRDLLAAQFEELNRGHEEECRGALFYDPKQRAHKTQNPNDPEFLRAILLERTETNVPGAVCHGGEKPGPVVTLSRGTTCYRVTEVPKWTKQAMPPISVFIERPLSRNANAGHLIHIDKGYVREGNLLSAIGEWRTWIVLADVNRPPVSNGTGTSPDAPPR